MGMGRTLSVLVIGGLTFYTVRKYILRRRFLRELSIARITTEELKKKLDSGENIVIFDVRQDIDFEADLYIIPGAARIRFEQAESSPLASGDREIAVYCT